MKTIILILLASVAALTAIAGLAEPAVTEAAVPAFAARAASVGGRRPWRDIAGGQSILAPRFVPPGSAEPAVVVASLPSAAPDRVGGIVAALPRLPPDMPSRAAPSAIPVLPSPKLPPRLAPAAAVPPAAILPAAAPAKPETASGPSPKLQPAPEKPPSAALPPAHVEAVRWAQPLVDRVLTASQRAEDLSAELQDAVFRMEPIFDPTRIDGAVDAAPLRVSAGSATMSNVFGERWRLASEDANVDATVRSIGVEWRDGAPASCENFVKRRPHEVGEATLTALAPADCAAVIARAAKGFDDAAPVPVVVAAAGLPAFAAPMPGARMSSRDFWAAQKARVEAVEARLRDKRFALQPHAMATNAKP